MHTDMKRRRETWSRPLDLSYWSIELAKTKYVDDTCVRIMHGLDHINSVQIWFCDATDKTGCNLSTKMLWNQCISIHQNVWHLKNSIHSLLSAHFGLFRYFKFQRQSLCTSMFWIKQQSSVKVFAFVFIFFTPNNDNRYEWCTRTKTNQTGKTYKLYNYSFN